MSVKVSSWVWHGDECAELTGNEVILMLALADVADDNGRCRFLADEQDMTYAALARKARISKSTMIRLVARFREAGLLEHAPGVKGRPNEFRVLVPWAPRFGVTVEPNVISGGADSVSPETDSVSSEATFGVKPDSRTSIQRINVTARGETAQKRGTRIPQPFIVTPEMVLWARQHAALVDGLRSTQRFENYWLAKTGKDATKLDWERTWRNWMLKDQEDAERRPGVRAAPMAKAASIVEMGQRMQAEADRKAVSA